MKHKLFYTFFICLALTWMSLYPNGAAFNGQGDRTGSPIAQGTCGSIGCHSGGNFNPVTTIQLLDTANNPVKIYKPGAVYTFKIAVSGTGSKQYGFQATALTDSNSNAGVFSALPSTVRSVKVSTHTVVEHKVPSTPGVWSFKWTAPITKSGGINFYACGLATNQNGNNSGDQADTSYLKLDVLTAVLDKGDQIFDVDLINRENQQVELNIKTDRSLKLSLEIVNYMGEVFLKRDAYINSGGSVETLDIKKLTNGIYFICIKSTNQMLVKKFLKY